MRCEYLQTFNRLSRMYIVSFKLNNLMSFFSLLFTLGCDQKHEEEMDPEAIYKNFVLRVSSFLPSINCFSIITH